MESNDHVAKYRELYCLSKEVLGDEDKRVFEIENKASKYVPVVAIMLGGFSFLGRSVLETMCTLGFVSFLLFTLLAAEFVLLILITYFLMKCLRNREYLSRPIDVEFFDHNDLPAIYRTLAEKNAEASESNRKRNNDKVRHMRNAHNLIVAASTIFFIIIAGYGGVLLEKSFAVQQTKGKEKQMGDDNSNNQSSNQQSTTIQQPNIPTPTTQPKPYEVLERSMPNNSVPIQRQQK